MKRLLALLTLAALVTVPACGGKDSGGSPTQPTPTPEKVRAISLEGSLNFETVMVGQSREQTIRIRNSGNDPLAVTGLTINYASNFAASWTSGTVPAGTAQDVTIRFSPTARQSYNGTLTVNSDKTQGTNTMSVTAAGDRPIWSRAGMNDTVFDMPTDVGRVRITGDYAQNSSNFVVYIGGRLIVNELLGRGWGMTHFEGTYVTTGGVTEIKSSSGVSWTFTEVR